jgi:hypothetical protein
MQENKELAREEKVKMSPFNIEGDIPDLGTSVRSVPTLVVPREGAIGKPPPYVSKAQVQLWCGEPQE